MQNNVTDLLQKLQRSLDNNYNVIDMPTVIEIFSALEKTSVTKELLETTRLGKHINELRRRTSNESLAKRAKELVKKWRVLLLPDANGHVEASKKRSARPTSDSKAAKRPIANGQNRELDFSDNSNCSVKDYKKTDVIFINSDSNSSLPDQSEAVPSHSDTLAADTPSDAIPKKRGRKKGSKNHKNLVIAAEESFSNKMAVGRNSKVKTTQELLADLQNRATTPKTATQQDIELRTAQLTESLSRIDQKLNPQKQINKNVTPIRNTSTSVNNTASRSLSHRTETWSSRPNSPEVTILQSDDEIVDVVGTDPPIPKVETTPVVEPLSVESLLKQLPPVDPSCLEEEEDSIPACECPLPPVTEPTADRITVQIVDEGKSLFAPSPLSFGTEESDTREVDAREVDALRTSCDIVPNKDEENVFCPAYVYLREKYPPEVTDNRVERLHNCFLPNVNGNWGVRTEPAGASADVVPRLGVERLPKATENFQKYSISEQDDERAAQEAEFREWHETLDVASYNGDLLRILPYVIID